VLTEAIDAARSIGDHRLEARAAMRRILARILLDPQASPELSLREAERCVGLFEGWQDDLGTAEARSLVGTIYFWQGRMVLAEENLELAIAHARRWGNAGRRPRAFGGSPS
jgi:hypothetical protein